MAIQFFTEDISFSLSNDEAVSLWLMEVATKHEREVEQLNYIFCSDEFLLQVNKDYLQHDYYTDVITFDNSEPDDDIEGDIFISIDRVRENADIQSNTFYAELHRVMVHGLLHLLGFNDKTADEENDMREREDACLSLLKN